MVSKMSGSSVKRQKLDLPVPRQPPTLRRAEKSGTAFHCGGDLNTTQTWTRTTRD